MVRQNPSLIITDAKNSKAPQIPAATDPEVTVWRDRHGALGALSHVVDKEPWLHVLGVASYKLDLAKNAVLAVPCEHATPEAIVDEFQSTAWPTALQIQGWEVLHSSAVNTSRGVVALCAASETGKSTLAYALSQRGYAQWADDVVVLEISPQSVRAHPLPYHIRLRPASALYFGYSHDQIRGGRVRCEGLQKDGAVPLRTICLLEQAETLPGKQVVTIEPLTGAEALIGALEHALYFSLQDRLRKRRMMQQYLNLIRQVAVFKVRFHRGLERLPSIVDRLEQRILAEISV